MEAERPIRGPLQTQAREEGDLDQGGNRERERGGQNTKVFEVGLEAFSHRMGVGSEGKRGHHFTVFLCSCHIGHTRTHTHTLWTSRTFCTSLDHRS